MLFAHYPRCPAHQCSAGVPPLVSTANARGFDWALCVTPYLYGALLSPRHLLGKQRQHRRKHDVTGHHHELCGKHHPPWAHARRVSVHDQRDDNALACTAKTAPTCRVQPHQHGVDHRDGTPKDKAGLLAKPRDEDPWVHGHTESDEQEERGRQARRPAPPQRHVVHLRIPQHEHHGATQQMRHVSHEDSGDGQRPLATRQRTHTACVPPRAIANSMYVRTRPVM